MAEIQKVAERVEEILGMKGKVEEDVCSLEKKRKELDVELEGRKFKGEVSIEVKFESLESDGTALNYAEITLLEEEIPAFTKALTENGLAPTAIHNHWVTAQPNILYLHLQKVDNPERFAENFSSALNTLK